MAKSSSLLSPQQQAVPRDLSPAHKGYHYQDQAAALFFIRSLFESFDQITVDKKEVDDDRFDDLSVRQTSTHSRLQFKSSDDRSRVFRPADLLGTRHRIRIDDLVRTHQRFGPNAPTEYRLCATWLTPTDPRLLDVIEPTTADPSFPGHPTKLFRLRSGAIWPSNGPSIWPTLLNAQDLDRQTFADFAERFIIELECPPSSRDFNRPDALESLILDLLSESIGIGRYPHQNRSPIEVASVLQQYAHSARTERRAVKPNDIERALQLNKDFGRVEQEFPITSSAVVKRGFLRQEITRLLGSQYVILEGPPGSGKSWELFGLANDLSAKGYVVARHYCYLEPGDPQVQRRIKTDVMFGNLIYDLVEDNPALEKIHRPAYAAGRRELEDLLRKGVEQGALDKAVLIVDGVDHISRVFAESTGVSRDEIDIVEELASLNLPEGVCLVIGTQPGSHLDPLRNRAGFVSMPVWRLGEIAGLASRLGVPTQLRRAGLSRDVIRQFLRELHERSEGNPLYATFLCRFTLEQIAMGGTFDVVSGLRDAPLTGGNISVYYQYLLRTAIGSGATEPLAELLGLIDFGTTEQELKEILPSSLTHHVEVAISHLKPVLDPNRLHKGVRIYHESFRRFIKDWLVSKNASIGDVLSQVIDWLKKRDFFDDPRTYRFLLPTLRRANRNRELLDQVGVDFVSRSVEAGHPRKAVEQNLSLATYSAAEELAWADLARCVELQKSCNVCFEDKLTDFDLYGRAFATVHGADKLAERMVFDGQPAFSIRQGLLFCSLCDDAGAVAPWPHYLWRSENETDARSSEDKDWVTDALAEFHGLVRLEGAEALSKRIVTWLRRVNNPEPRYFRGMLERLNEFGGRGILESMLSTAAMSAEVEALVLLELAYAMHDEGQIGEASSYASAAVKKTGNTGVAVECLLLGADQAEVAKRCPTLENFGVGNEERYDPNASALRIWVEGVRIAAAVDPAQLGNLEAKVPGEGWYSNWLRFVIGLARAEELNSTDEEAAEVSIVEAFTLLASDTERFKGDPRPCDLYSQRKIIHETIARGLLLIRDPKNFKLVLSLLAAISEGTTSYLNNSPGGPLIAENFLEILMPYVAVESFKTVTIAEMLAQQEKIRQGGELYDTLATADLLLARALATAGESEQAEALWRSASVHLCAYGYRRDLSILDLTESASALAQLDQTRASELMAAAQPLVNAVDAHTDGKETQYTPIYWSGALAKVNAAASAYVVGCSSMRHGGVVDWRHENAFEHVVDALREVGEPSLVGLMDATLPKAGHRQAIADKLMTIQRVMSEDKELGTSLLRALAAKARGGDSEQLVDQALYQAIGCPESELSLEVEAPQENNQATSSSFLLDRFFRANYRPMFEVAATPFDLSIGIRAYRQSDRANDPGQQQLLNALGYRLVEMINRNQETEATRLLTSLAREVYFWQSATLLAEFGEGLERHGHPREAAVAFTLAYVHSRGDRGYLLLGDEEQLPWFLKACELSKDTAFRVLANEIAYLLHDHTYSRGITRHLTELLAARLETKEVAFASWEAAYGVLNHRLPRNEADYDVFEKYDPTIVPGWSVDEALVFLLLARLCHPELGRKTSAVAAFMHIVCNKPDIIGKPLTHFLSSNSPISSVLLTLQTLLLAETSPYVITHEIKDQLRSLYRSGLFAFRVMSEELIERAELDLGEQRRTPRFSPTAMPDRRRDAILSIDWGNRIQTIAKIWTDFPNIVAGLFNEKWEGSKMLRDRSRQRHEASRSRGYPTLPPKQFLHWEVEAFESVFQEVLEGIDAELWRTGEWNSSVPRLILPNILPRIDLHVGRWFSRTKRPDLQMPSELSTRVVPAEPISSKDAFDGWYRCGYYEREIVMRGIVDVEDDVSLMSGLHVAVKLSDLDDSMTPFARGNADVWLQGIDPSQWSDFKINSTLPDNITGIEFVRDWLGEFPVLMLQPYLQVRCGLSPRDSLSLELVDEDEKVGAAFRRWEERIIGESVGEEVPRLRGCELLVRPDLFDRIQQQFEQPLVMVTQPLRSSRLGLVS